MNLPVLQKILSVLNLVLRSCDGDDTILRTLQRLVDFDGGSGFVTDLLNALTTFPDDRAGQLLQDKRMFRVCLSVRVCVRDSKRVKVHSRLWV